MMNANTASRVLPDNSDVDAWLNLAKGERYQEVLDAINIGRVNPEALKNNNGVTVWHYLALGGHYDALVKAITEKRFESEKLKDINGKTVWHYLASGGHYDSLVRAITEKRFDPEKKKNPYGKTVWHYLAWGQHYDALFRAITEKRFNPSILNERNGKTVWHCLASGGHYDYLVKAITEKQLEPEKLKDTSGRTVWDYLAFGGHYDALVKAVIAGLLSPLRCLDYKGKNLCDRFPKLRQKLNEKGVDWQGSLRTATTTTTMSQPVTPSKVAVVAWLKLAKSERYQEALDAITQGKFNPKTHKSLDGSSVWHYLAWGGHYDALIRAITEGRFNPETYKNLDNSSVWHYLALGGHYDALIRAITEGRFNPKKHKNLDGLSVWHHLAHGGHYDALVKAVIAGKLLPLQVLDNTGKNLLDSFPRLKQTLFENGVDWQAKPIQAQIDLTESESESVNLLSAFTGNVSSDDFMPDNEWLEALSLLAEPNITPTLRINAKPKVTAAGIANKYLNHNLLNLPDVAQNARVGMHQYQFQASYKFTNLDSIDFSDELMALDLNYFEVEHAGAKFKYYTYNSSGLPGATDKVIFVFAGRGIEALFPRPEVGCRVVLVVTDAEFEKDFKSERVENLDVLSISELKSATHGDYEQGIGSLNARRLAALIFSNNLGLEHCLCLDDNIEEILVNNMPAPDLNTLYDYLLQAQQSTEHNNPVLLGMSTLSNVSTDITHNKFCAKVHFWDLKALFAKLSSPQDLYFLAYPAAHTKLWGEDYLQQLMLQELFSQEARAPFALMTIDKIAFKRAIANRNSFIKHGGTKADDLLSAKIFESIHSYQGNNIHARLQAAIQVLLGIVRSNVERIATQMELERKTDLLALHARLNNINYNQANFTARVANAAPISMATWSARLDSNKQGMGNILMPHQQQAIQSLIDKNSYNGRIVMATGTGKTMLQIAMSLNALQLKSNTPIIIVTPSMILVEQFYQEFIQKNRELKNVCPQLACDEAGIIKVDSGNASISALTMCENRSLVRQNFVAIFCLDSYLLMLKTPNNEYLKSAKFVLLDEYQEYSAADLHLVYNNAKANNALCYGLSATPPIQDVFATAEIFNYGLNRAIADKVVSPIKIEKLEHGYGRDKVNKYLITENLKALLETKHADGVEVKNRKTIIYLPGIVFIEKFKDKINNVYPEISVFAIHTKNSNRDEHLQEFKDNEGAAIALACWQMRVGFSDPKVYTVIYLQAGKDSIDVQQAAGRALRIDRQNENKVGLIISFADANTSGLEAGPPPLRLASVSPDLVFSRSSTSATRRSRFELEDEIEFIPLGSDQSKKRRFNR